MTEHARVVVVGGGIMGVSTLYHLTKLGWNDCLLVEKSDLTHGSTWHAAGICTNFAHSPTIMQIRADSLGMYRKLLQEDVKMSVGFKACGGLRLAQDTNRMDEYQHVRGIGQVLGYDFEIVTPQDIKKLHPLVYADGLLGGIYEPNDGFVDPSLATHAFATGARKRGARILRNNRVIRIDRTRMNEWRVVTLENEIICEQIVNAAGTWCREIGNLVGVDLPVVPILHQYWVSTEIDTIASYEGHLPIIRDPDESWYVRQELNGLICGAYEQKPETWGVNGIPKNFAADLLPSDLDRNEEEFEAAMFRIPLLGLAGVKNSVRGPITFTPDANPLIGPTFGVDNSWVITGSSMGVMEGGGAGKYLAEWIEGGEPPLDPTAVDSRRFGEYADRNYRVAKGVESFAKHFSVHYPHEQRVAARPCQTSAIYQPLIDAGAVNGAVFGWERPVWYQTKDKKVVSKDSFRRPDWFHAVGKECKNVAKSVGLIDLSAVAKFKVKGPDAEKFMRELGSNIPPNQIGRVSIIHVLSQSGGVLAEVLALKISDDTYYLTSSAAAGRRDLDLLRRRALKFRVNIQCVTADYCVIGLMGPKARVLANELTSSELTTKSFPWLSAKEIEFASTRLLAIRISYIGESGWEFHIPSSHAGKVYSSLIEVGEKYRLGHFGAFAMDSMRLEKGHRAWGMDLTTERTPLEAGLSQFVKTENRDFIGRDAMLQRQDSINHWRMETLEIHCREIDPFYLHPVFQKEQVVGVITSGSFGHRTGKTLALAYFNEKAGNKKVEFEVEIIGRRYSATVLPNPAYDPSNLLLKTD